MTEINDTATPAPHMNNIACGLINEKSFLQKSYVSDNTTASY